MNKLIELIERHRDKWQKKWTKGTQLRDSNSENYDPFLHGASVGATKAYNNVLQWIKNPSIMSGDKDLALTWQDVAILITIYEQEVEAGNISRYVDEGAPSLKDASEIILRKFNEIKQK